MIRTVLGFAGLIALTTTGCASADTHKQAAAGSETSNYVAAQQPAIAQVAPAVRACTAADTDVVLTWGLAADGHVEDIVIHEPATPSVKEHNCIMSAAMRAQFAAPSNHKRLELTKSMNEAETAVSQL